MASFTSGRVCGPLRHDELEPLTIHDHFHLRVGTGRAHLPDPPQYRSLIEAVSAGEIERDAIRLTLCLGKPRDHQRQHTDKDEKGVSWLFLRLAYVAPALSEKQAMKWIVIAGIALVAACRNQDRPQQSESAPITHPDSAGLVCVRGFHLGRADGAKRLRNTSRRYTYICWRHDDGVRGRKGLRYR